MKYEDFYLTEKEHKSFLDSVCSRKVSEYIREHGYEPSEITDEFYYYTDDEFERFKRYLYSSRNSQNLKTVKEVILEDYDSLLEETDSFYYWESHIVLNKKIEEAETLGELLPSAIENIFESNEIIIKKTTNLLTGEKSEERKPDAWFESVVLQPSEIVISVFDALKIYWNSGLKTTGDKISLRRPLNPTFEEPYYIIGQQDSPLFVFISAKDGHIKNLD